MPDENTSAQSGASGQAFDYGPDMVPASVTGDGRALIANPDASTDDQQAHQLRQHTLIAASRFGVVTDEDLANHDGQNVSVLVRSDGGHVVVHTGTIEYTEDRPWLIPHDPNTSNHRGLAIPLDRRGPWAFGSPVEHTVHQLAVPGGPEAAEWMTNNFVESMHATRVGPPTLTDLPIDDGETEPPSAVAAIYQYDHPGFSGGRGGAGCLFFATDITPNNERGAEDPLAGDPIVNGYLWVPDDSGLTSESGSIYRSDLERLGAARLDVDTEHLSVANMWRDLLPDRQGVMALIETPESGDRPTPLSCARCGQARFATTTDLDAHTRWCFGDNTNGENL